MKGQEDVYIIELPLDKIMTMSHKEKGKVMAGSRKNKKKVGSRLRLVDDVSIKGPSRRSYLTTSSENFVVGGSSKRNLAKESAKDKTMDLLFNSGYEIDLKHKNGKDHEELAYLTLIKKTI